jgi:hypothetical protein
MNGVFAVAAASAMLGLIAGAGAPQRAALLSGVISDTTGGALPGAMIVVVSDEGGRRTTTTDAKGRYWFGDPATGRYLVQASMAGFDTRVGVVSVSAGSNAIWSSTLLVASPIGAVSLEREVRRVTGVEALDCGRYAAPVSEAALRNSLACSIASARDGKSFSVIVQFVRGPTRGAEGLLAGFDGAIKMFRYENGDARISLKACPSPQVMPKRDVWGAGFRFTCQP